MANLLSELRFASLLAYAPQGQSPISLRSRDVRSAIKRGDRQVLELAAHRLEASSAAWLSEFFSSDTFLVPVPGSSPRKDSSALWVPRAFCRQLAARGLGREVQECLERSSPVPKSAYAAPQDRPRPSRHYDSLRVRGSLFAPRRITLVDDVITRGATLVAAASRVLETYPECEVRAFAILRTMTRVEVDPILSPCSGIIRYDATTDSSWRDP